MSIPFYSFLICKERKSRKTVKMNLSMTSTIPRVITLHQNLRIFRVVSILMFDVIDGTHLDSPPFDSIFLSDDFLSLPISQQIQNEQFKKEYKDFFYPHTHSDSDTEAVAPPVIKPEEPSTVDINYVIQGDTLKIHIPSTTKRLLIEKDGCVISVDTSSFNAEPVIPDDPSTKKRNRVPFLPLEREYIMSCYYNLVESGYMSKAACARMIWNEIYSNVSKDGDNEIVNAIRRPLRSLNKPDIKKDRSMRSILNLIYNRTTKRVN